MAYRKVDETSLTAVANAIRTKGGTTEALSFPDGFVSAVEGIQAGGVGAVLLYETEFSLTETPSTSVNLAYITTELSSDGLVKGDAVLCVIKCTNDFDTDMSYSHLKAQIGTFYICDDNGAISGKTTTWSMWHDNGYSVSTATNVGFKSIGSYFGGFQLTVRSDYTGFGIPAPGDYSFKLYLVSGKDIGLEGVV